VLELVRDLDRHHHVAVTVELDVVRDVSDKLDVVKLVYDLGLAGDVLGLAVPLSYPGRFFLVYSVAEAGGGPV
jgi:hypothetical protein